MPVRVGSRQGFYCCPVDKKCRSRMNVPFTIMGGNEARARSASSGRGRIC